MPWPFGPRSSIAKERGRLTAWRALLHLATQLTRSLVLHCGLEATGFKHKDLGPASSNRLAFAGGETLIPLAGPVGPFEPMSVPNLGQAVTGLSRSKLRSQTALKNFLVVSRPKRARRHPSRLSGLLPLRQAGQVSGTCNNRKTKRKTRTMMNYQTPTRRQKRQNGTGHLGWRRPLRSHAAAPCCRERGSRRHSQTLYGSRTLAKLAALSGGLRKRNAHAILQYDRLVCIGY